MEFKQYQRKEKAELRPVTTDEILEYDKSGTFLVNKTNVSISEADRKNKSPRKGDMVARNPKNHNDLWLVAEKYFTENFEKPLDERIEEFIQDGTLDSIEVPVVELQEYINVMEKLGYDADDTETNGWQIDFWVIFSRSFGGGYSITLSGGLFYGHYNLSKSKSED